MKAALFFNSDASKRITMCTIGCGDWRLATGDWRLATGLIGDEGVLKLASFSRRALSFIGRICFIGEIRVALARIEHLSIPLVEHLAWQAARRLPAVHMLVERMLQPVEAAKRRGIAAASIAAGQAAGHIAAENIAVASAAAAAAGEIAAAAAVAVAAAAAAGAAEAGTAAAAAAAAGQYAVHMRAVRMLIVERHIPREQMHRTAELRQR